MALLVATMTFGQQQTVFPLLLKNGTIKASEKLPQAEPMVYDGYRYVIIQKRDLAVKANFHGFEVLEYLPKFSGFARVAVEDFEQARQNLTVAGGAVLDIQPDWKLSPALYNANYPEWAWLGEKDMKIWLRYWPGLDHQRITRELAFRQMEVIDQKPAEDLIALRFNPEEISRLQGLPFVVYIQEMEDPGEPENFTARTSVRVNTMQSPAKNGLHYDGSGVIVGHNDAGLLGEHIDFKGRLTQVGNSSSTSDHGDHTAGTIFGAGNRDPRAEGMAPGSDMYYALYPANLNNADAIYNNQNVRLTSNSFSNGCNNGYTNFTRQVDQDAIDNPNMLHVFSAGNNGTSDCGYGAGAGWGNVTGGHKQGKNVIAVANFTRTDALATSSSRGPASDGRVKPDIAAVGTSVNSTTDIPAPNSYDRKTGTSMSCPGITGSLAVLMEAYKAENGGNEPEAALLKGMLLNGADDLGGRGPDFRHGYGRANIRNSYQMLTNGQYFTNTLGTGDSLTFSVNVPANIAHMKVMLIWSDPAASTSAARALVNDLDMELDDNGTNYQPWVLDPTPNSVSLQQAASRGRDSLNNMEQVTLDNPGVGTKTIKVKGFNVPNGPQRFYLLYYFEKDEIAISYPLPGEAIASFSAELVRWDAPYNYGPFAMDLSFDGGSTYSNVISNLNSNHYTWNTPALAQNDLYLRIRSAQDTQEVGPLTLLGVPGNIQFGSICPDSVELNWSSITGASGYVVYQLGAKYMDSVTYVTSPSAKISHNAFREDWYAVAGVINDTSVGFRSLAVKKDIGIQNCAIKKDLMISRVISPGKGALSDCFNTSALPVTVEIVNTGLDSISGFATGYLGGGFPARIENYSGVIAPGDTVEYTFQNSTLLLRPNAINDYQFWVETAVPDNNPFNDTLLHYLQSYSASNTISTFPYQEDFESFNLCSTASDCGLISCSTENGWFNARNFSADDIDFRPASGSTPSTGTGPNFDHNPGHSGGVYLYTEASGDCDSAEALFTSPCIDLNGTYRPEASIWYHMNGTGHMGVLTVDVFDGKRWYLDAAGSPIAGHQGSQWQELKIDLSRFRDNTIVLRFRAKTGSSFRSDISIDDFSIYDLSGVGLSELAQAEFRVYPNPYRDNFFIELNEDINPENTEIRVSNLAGQTIWAGAFENNAGTRKMQIDLGSSASGLYLVEITSEGYKATTRLSKI